MVKQSRRRYRKRRNNPTNKRIAKIAKNVQLNLCENKKSTQYRQAGITPNLNHNTTFYVKNLLKTTQGPQNPEGINQNTLNRVGDEVIARSLKLKFHIANVATRPNVMYKIIVFKYRSEFTASDANFWSGSAGLGAQTNRMLDFVRSDKIKVLGQKMLATYPSPSYTMDTVQKNKAYYVDFNINLHNMKVKYNADNSQYTRWTDVGFAVVGYDDRSTLTTDNVGILSWSSRFYYADP